MINHLRVATAVSVLIIAAVLVGGITVLGEPTDSGSWPLAGANETVDHEWDLTSVAARSDGAHPALLEPNADRSCDPRFTTAERTANGLPLLRFNPQLDAVASSDSRRQATQGFFADIGLDGQTLADRYRLFGIECRLPVAENELQRGRRTSRSLTSPRT